MKGVRMRFWKALFGNREPQTSSILSTDEKLSQIAVGMSAKDVINRVGKCKNITTMGSALNQASGFVASKETLSQMSQTELWVYETQRKKYKFFLTNGIVDEIKSGSK